MATGIAFLLVCIGVGYAGYWMIINEKADPNGGYLGLFAMTQPKTKPVAGPIDLRQERTGTGKRTSS